MQEFFLKYFPSLSINLSRFIDFKTDRSLNIPKDCQFHLKVLK